MKQGRSYTIYKINSDRIKRSKWDLVIDHDKLRKAGEVVGLSESTLIRIIRQIKNINEEEFKKKIAHIEVEIANIRKEKSSIENSNKIKNYNEQLRKILHIEDLVLITMNKIEHFDRLNSDKGFKLDGIKYKRLFGTAGGVKKKTVFYASERIYDELVKRIENGRDMNIEISAAKLEAYKALISSSSIPVDDIDPKHVLVVPDCITSFKEKVIRIFDEENKEYPTVIEVDDYPIENNASDGFGLISPELAQAWGINSGACIRNAFCKGMVFPFKIQEFARDVAKKYEVIDVWGCSKDIRNIQLILTSSMLKLWRAYRCIEHYMKCCKDNGYTFSLTKTTPTKLEEQRNLNYQFIQSLYLSDNDIEELVKPTIDTIKDIMSNDYRKTLLYLKGTNMKEGSFFINENYDFATALMIEPKMNKDPYIRNKIKNLINKRINDAKKGDLIVNGNFAIASGDPYALCQSIFGMEVTGLLKAGEHYSRHWSDKGVSKVACFRAPMSVANNIRILNFKDTEDNRYWYEHMRTVNIFNAFDTTPHAQNGEDYDSDANLTTDNPVLLRVIEELPPIICEQGKVKPIIPNEDDLIKANKLSFGDDIGKVTNRGTSLYNVLTKFKKGSQEYNEVMYRIKCVQHYQQNAIDKTKGAEWKPFPKEWYSETANRINSGDSDEQIGRKIFNISILADKQPYFFIYRYPETFNKHKQYIKKHEDNCIFNYGIRLFEILEKSDRNDIEEKFVQNYYKYMPVSLEPSTMNRICWRIEEAFKGQKNKNCKDVFDYAIMKSENTYCQKKYKRLYSLYDEHNAIIQRFVKTNKENDIDKEVSKEQGVMLVQQFRNTALEICNDLVELTDILLDVCYSKQNQGKSKELVWSVCGEQILSNLLRKNNNTIKYPVKCDTGEIEYNGERFTLVEQKLWSE